MDESITELVARLQEEWREKILHDKEAVQVTQLKRKYKKHLNVAGEEGAGRTEGEGAAPES